MKYPQNIWDWHGMKVKSLWIKTKEVLKHKPIIQVYGIVFNNKNEILICRKSGDWQIPGGHPEKGETIEETLKRELIEETDVEIENIIPLGVVKSTFPDKPEAGPHYAVRCIANLKGLLPQTPDPDNGEMWERKFVPSSKIKEYIDWGVTGDVMFSDAIELRKRGTNASGGRDMA